MKKPKTLLDRDMEWAALTDIWQRTQSDLVFLLGRRRVGKSYLLTRFAHAVKGIYYQATNRSAGQQLRRLSEIIGRHFQDPALRRGVPFPDWEALFEYLADHAREVPLLLVLDEFPYLASSDPALPSVLQSFWDQGVRKAHLKLILCGSHITAMQRLEAADQPLYGRRTARLVIEPFAVRDIEAFAPQYSARDRLRAYGIFGGLPGNLALLDPARPLAANVVRHVLSPTGRLLDEAQHMLDAFLAGAQVHYSIIEAIARGERTWAGISKRVDREGGSLSRAMSWLDAMDLVARVTPITESAPEKSKRAVYRITDPYVAFWHRFVSPLTSAGMIGLTSPERLWEHEIEPRLDDYMGSVFESACRQFVRQSPRLPFPPVRVGEWWDADSRNEIDVVALGEYGRVLAAECKWGQIDMNDLLRLRARADLLVNDLKNVREVHLALFSSRKITDSKLRAEIAAGRVLHFSAEDLFAR